MPPAEAAGLECKANLWHDPKDGQFTSAGAGLTGGGNSGSSDVGRRPPPKRTGRLGAAHQSGRSPAPSVSKRPTPRPGTVVGQPSPVSASVGGVGEGLYDVGKDLAADAHAVLTTNPVTTVRNVGRGIADAIDGVIAAEDTLARVQVARAAEEVRSASTRDIGRATGMVAGNVALAAAPGAGLAKVNALRRLRTVRPRTPYDPPQIGWVKKNLKKDSAWKAYNDSADGARPGQAPTLIRTMPNGLKRHV